MGKISLHKRSGDIYAICGVVLLTASVFSSTFRRLGSNDLEVRAYIRDKVVSTLNIHVNKVYVFVAPEHFDQIPSFNPAYDVIKLDESDGQYLLGPITVEIKNQTIDVLSETSQKNYCSIMAPTSQPNWPLTCAPNRFRIVIEAKR